MLKADNHRVIKYIEKAAAPDKYSVIIIGIFVLHSYIHANIDY